MPLSRITEALACFEEIQYRAGEIILKEGDEGDNFFLIKSGTV